MSFLVSARPQPRAVAPFLVRLAVDPWAATRALCAVDESSPDLHTSVVNPGRLAENLRRAAGAHLVSLDSLAQHVGMTRGGLMKLLADDGEKRTLPSSTTIMRLAEAFGVDPRTLMSEDTPELLSALAESFEHAPVRSAAKVPEPEVRPRFATVGEVMKAARDAGIEPRVVPIESKRKGKRQ